MALLIVKKDSSETAVQVKKGELLLPTPITYRSGPTIR